MAAATPVSVTVRIPYADDHTVQLEPHVTSQELCARVLAADGAAGRPADFSLVYQGRVLPDDLPAVAADLVDGAVLHLVPRPNDRSAADAAAAAGAGPPHHGHHDHAHAPHANLVFGHISVDGRVQYADVRQVLSSVLQALGFSPYATAAAADIGAAIAVANEAAADRGEPAQSVVNIAWADTQRAQRTVTPPIDEADRLRDDRPRFDPEDAHAMELEEGIEDSTSLDPERFQSYADVAESISAAEIIFPAMATVLQRAGTRLAATSPSDLLAVSDPSSAEAVLAELGAVAGALTSTTALFSTMIPPRDGVHAGLQQQSESQGASPESSGTLPVVHHHHVVAAGLDASDHNLSSVNLSAPRTNWSRAGPTGPLPGMFGSARSPMGRPHTLRNSPAGDADLPGSMSRALSNVAPMMQSMLANALEAAQSSAVAAQETNSLAYSEEQECHADFLVRILSLFYCSLAGIGEAPVRSGRNQDDDSEEPWASASEKLAELFAGSDFMDMENPALIVLNILLDQITPEQFHDVCCGNFESLAIAREGVWDCIRDMLDEEDVLFDDSDVGDVFVETLSQILHDWVHAVQDTIEMRERRASSAEGGLCGLVMPILEHQLTHFVELMYTDDAATCISDVEFPSAFTAWLDWTVGSFLLALSTVLQNGWEDVVAVLRSSAHDIGVHLLGPRCAVLLPFLVNLMMYDIERSFDRACFRMEHFNELHFRASDPNSDEHDESAAVAAAAMVQALVGGRMGRRPGVHRAHGQESEAAGAAGEGASPAAADAGQASASGTASRAGNGIVSNAVGSGSGNDDGEDNDRNRPGVAIGSAHQAESDVDLDDDEMDALAAELNDEMSSYSSESGEDIIDGEMDDLVQELAGENDVEVKESLIQNDNAGGSDSEFDDLAAELASEVGQGAASSSTTVPALNGPHATSNGNARSHSAVRAKFSVPRPAGSQFTSSLTGGAPGAGSIREASFSRGAHRAANPAAQTVGSTMEARRGRDILDEVLGMREGARWRRTLLEDAGRMGSTPTRSPLSRGYRGARSHVPVLDSTVASELSADAVRAVAGDVGITGPALTELVGSARGLGSLFLPEVESAIQARVATDPDFDPQRFPAAAARFS